MSKLQIDQINQRRSDIRKGLILSLIINGILPTIVYVLSRPIVSNDAGALAVAGAIPAIRTITVLIWRRRVDWIGVFALLGFSIALAVSAFSDGGTLILKIHEQLLTGTIGLVLLISVAINKPLLRPLLVALRGNDFKNTNNRRVVLLTTALGLVLLGDAAIHVILALNVSTVTYLATSRIITWAMMGGVVAVLWWTRSSAGTRSKENKNQEQGETK